MDPSFSFIYCLGNQLVLPFVIWKCKYLWGNHVFGFLVPWWVETSGPCLFFSGLVAQMSAMTWQMFSLRNGFEKSSHWDSDRRRMYLALGIAICSIFGSILEFIWLLRLQAPCYFLMNNILMIVGTFFWFGYQISTLSGISPLSSWWHDGQSAYQIMYSIENSLVGMSCSSDSVQFDFLYVSGVVQRLDTASHQ